MVPTTYAGARAVIAVRTPFGHRMTVVDYGNYAELRTTRGEVLFKEASAEELISSLALTRESRASK